MSPPVVLRPRSSDIVQRPRRDLAVMQGRALRTRRRRTVEGREPSRVSVWLPVTPLFWILAPFAFLLAPLLLLVPPLWRANPYLTVFTIGRVLTSLGGTDIHVDTHDARIRVRIF